MLLQDWPNNAPIITQNTTFTISSPDNFKKWKKMYNIPTSSKHNTGMLYTLHPHQKHVANKVFFIFQKLKKTSKKP